MRFRKFLWGIMTGLLLTGGAEAQQQFAFQVNFKDKVGSPPLSDSASFLSAKALARRAQQGIVVDSTDQPVSPAYIDSVLTLTGGEMHETSRWLNFCVILLNDSSQILTLQNKPYIDSIKQVAYYTSPLHALNPVHVGPSKSPGPGSLYKTTGSMTYYGYSFPQTEFVHGDFLHDQGFKGQGKLIAVLDAGFIGVDTSGPFDSIRQTNRILDTHDFTYDDDVVYSYDNHGEEVLSTMAANVPGTSGYVGSAPEASYALYITEDDNSEQPIELDNLIAGAERADSLGADIISISLGYNLFDINTSPVHYDPIYNFTFAANFDGKTTVAAKAANMATQKGMLFVASAGNEGGDSWNMVLTPGDADSALTVGNVNINEVPASNSGYGPNAAGQIKPDVCDLGDDANICNGDFTNVTGDGTSFSTPQIAGWAACLWQMNPNATTGEIRRAIDRSADHYTDPGSQIGYGVPNFEGATQILSIQDSPPAKNVAWVTASPNPFTNEINLSVISDTPGTIYFKLMDISGKTVATTEHFFDQGYNPLYTLTVNNLPDGVYILKAVSATQHDVIKLEKR